MTRFVPLIFLTVSLTVIGNILLKTGAVVGTGVEHHPTTLVSWRVIGNLLNWQVILGLGAFAVGVCFYIISLRYLPLNIVQSFVSAQFIGTVLASAVVLSEPVDFLRWIGIVLIAVGIAVVGWSTN